MPETQVNVEQAVGSNGDSASRPIMLAICGDSATGKTTISDG